ncbi:lipopolysaccharide biosynthesis protein [Pseudonocardia sp. DLS-67]
MTTLQDHPVSTRSSISRLRAGVLRGWGTPQHRDGLALVLSSGLTSGLGLLFWIVAARLYDSATVGVNSAVLSAMTLLGTAAQLNLGNALLRFVPVAGPRTRALVVGCYAAAVAAASLAGAVFALGASWWAPQLHTVFGGSALVVFFTLSTPVWAMFVMQDYLLPALKKATVVPVENLVFSVLKIVFLGGAAALGMWSGLAVAWVAATAVIVLVVSVYLMRVLPRTTETEAEAAPSTVTIRDVASFVRADYAGTVLLLAAVFGLPLVVLARLGPEAAALYGIAFQIAYALYLVVNGMGQSLVAHLAADPHKLEAARRSMVHKAMVLLVPAVVAIAVGAYPLLSLFGARYAEEGSLLLVLLVLSAIPNVVTWSTVWAARVRRDGRVLFGLPAAITTAVIAGSWFLMPVLGVVGAGVAWLGAQSVAAAGLLLVRAARR